MKKIIFVLALFLLTQIGIFAETPTDEAHYLALNIPVKKLYASPDERSKVLFENPISVRIISVTPDNKWFKVRVSYNFFGYFETEGWIKVQ